MYWKDVYAEDAGYRAYREERACRNTRKRIRKQAAQARKRRPIYEVSPDPFGNRDLRKPKTRRRQQKKTFRISKLTAALALALVVAFVGVATSFANPSSEKEFMPVPENDAKMVVSEPAGEKPEAGDVENISELVVSDAESQSEPEASNTISAAPSQPEVQNPSVAETADVPGIAPQGNAAPSENIDHTSIWEQVSAESFSVLDIDEKVDLIGAMAHDDELATGIPAELTAAQMILESGWMESGLTVKYNNCFGIKASSGGYNWEGSTWDGVSVVEMTTQEEYVPGEISTIIGGFRAYDSVWDSVVDHSAYLLNSGLYPGIADKGRSLDSVLQILTDGGYATGDDYADAIKELIRIYDLERFGD